MFHNFVTNTHTHTLPSFSAGAYLFVAYRPTYLLSMFTLAVPLFQLEALDLVERAFVHVDYARRDQPG
jgi:hypothetical protein